MFSIGTPEKKDMRTYDAISAVVFIMSTVSTASERELFARIEKTSKTWKSKGNKEEERS
jgi:hypothetical protein